MTCVGGSLNYLSGRFCYSAIEVDLNEKDLEAYQKLSDEDKKVFLLKNGEIVIEDFDRDNFELEDFEGIENLY